MPNSKLTRAESSRINGARSRGPKSEAGKQRSSQNALRHGFLANSVVLEGEDRDCFMQTLEYHIQKFRPKDGVEQDLIDEMVAAGWRMRRLWWIETELFNKATKAVTDPTISSRVASAFSRLAEGNQLHLLDRYESRLHKMYQRAFKTLLEIRKSEDFLPVPNEPEPTPSAEEILPEPNEPETVPAAQTPQLPNEPEIVTQSPLAALSSQDPLHPKHLAELEPSPALSSQQPTPYHLRPNAPSTVLEQASLPNEPENSEDCYPSFTFDAKGNITGKTYIRVSKNPTGDPT
jgi:hypothetical protein